MRILTTLLLVCYCALAASLNAQTASLSVQGVLKKSDGSAVPDDIYTLKFAFYDAEAGGNKIWEETINDIETTGGVYSAVLGVNGTTLSAPFDKPYFLSVKIGNSNQELLPRPRLSAAPYAMALLGAVNKVPSTGSITADGVLSSGLIEAQAGILARTGGFTSGTAPFNGYGFLGDGKTGYGSNAFGVASIWAEGVNVFNSTKDQITMTKPLYISGVKTLSRGGVVQSMSGSGFEALGSYTASFSLQTDGYLLPLGVYVHSDRRIKKDITRSNAASDLSVLQRLQVTDYKYKDAIAKGDVWKKGFIAQEVAQVVPEAVSTAGTEVIPDIYTLAKNTRLEAGTLQLTMEQAHGLKPGDKVRLIAGEQREDLLVQATPSATEFAVGQWTHGAPEKVFVYGRVVNDYHSVDYDRLYTLNISATQELARRVEALEKENAVYKSENAELRQLLESLRADVNALKGQQR